MFHTQARRQVHIPQLRSIDQSVERFLAHAFNTAGRPSTARPPQFTQDEQAITLALDLPGLSREQIAVTIDGNIVKIESLKDAPRSVQLAYEVAAEIDSDSSEAKLENGVLTLKLARKAQVQTARTLNIS